ncbi:PLD-like domain-containing protein [Ditylenchus destructor]|nr:PLD-like domain-containing protein [Ditylenchus destructor]
MFHCQVCRETLLVQDMCSFPCGHVVHRECVRDLVNQRTCPLCRAVIPPPVDIHTIYLEFENGNPDLQIQRLQTENETQEESNVDGLRNEVYELRDRATSLEEEVNSLRMELNSSQQQVISLQQQQLQSSLQSSSQPQSSLQPASLPSDALPRTVYVGRWDSYGAIDATQLRRYFEQFGNVARAWVSTEPSARTGQYYGSVKFETHESARWALHANRSEKRILASELQDSHQKASDTTSSPSSLFTKLRNQNVTEKKAIHYANRNDFPHNQQKLATGANDYFSKNDTNFLSKNANSIEQCHFDLIETIPTGMEFSNFPNANTSTFAAWKDLLQNAEKSVDIVAFYWTLRDETNYETSWQGAEIYNELISAAERNVKLRIVQHSPDAKFLQKDSADLAMKGLAEVRNLNFRRFGTGVLHTKMWIVDSKHVYIGSANMDWRSLTEVKELGVVLRNSPVIANDLQKIFSVYWQMSNGGHPPGRWPSDLQTNISNKRPLNLKCSMTDSDKDKEHDIASPDDVKGRLFISSSPPALNPSGREDDIDAIISVIQNASSFVRISVMEYLPATVFLRNKNYYWPVIDNAIRAAAYRGINVELLISHWRYSKKDVIPHLKSLLQFNDGLQRKGKRIQIKIHNVPSDEKQAAIDHARVNHAKYMVTDKAAYIGTNNWTADYFLFTGGVGMVIEAVDSPVIIEKFNQVFVRDWESPYATSLEL